MSGARPTWSDYSRAERAEVIALVRKLARGQRVNEAYVAKKQAQEEEALACAAPVAPAFGKRATRAWRKRQLAHFARERGTYARNAEGLEALVTHLEQAT